MNKTSRTKREKVKAKTKVVKKITLPKGRGKK
jgi:hypothetical protein